MRSSSRNAWAGAVIAVAVLLCMCATVHSRPLLAATADPVKCGDPPEHCKPKDAVCTLRTISECIPPYKCRGGKCSEPPTETAQGSSTAPAKEVPSTGEEQASTTKEATTSTDEALATEQEVAPLEGEEEGFEPEEGPPSDDTMVPIQCGDPPKHCKPKGADCKLGKVSECIKGLKCDKGTKKCVDRAGGDESTGGTEDPEVPSDDYAEEPEGDGFDTGTGFVQDSSTSTSGAAMASSSASTDGGGTATASSEAVSGR